MRISRLIGRGDRTRVSTDVTPLSHNDLQQRIKSLAALWLQLSVTASHDVARIVTIAEEWLVLPESQKVVIELEIQSVKGLANNGH